MNKNILNIGQKVRIAELPTTIGYWNREAIIVRFHGSYIHVQLEGAKTRLVLQRHELTLTTEA